jgi:hypothetical protein
MRRQILILTVLLLTAAHAAPLRADTVEAPSSESPQEHSARGQLQGASIDWRNGNMLGVVKRLEQLVSDPSFSLLNSQEQYAAHQLLGIGYLSTGVPAKALAELKKASETQWAAGSDWQLRLQAAVQAGDKPDTLYALTMIARYWSASLSSISDLFVLRTAAATADMPKANRLVLLQALYDSNWSPQDKTLLADRLWMDLAALLIDDGQKEKAAEVSKRISDANTLVLMLLDKRFDYIVAQDPQRFDPEKAADANLTMWREMMRSDPKSLRKLNVVAALLIELGRDQEALDLSNDALLRVKKDAAAFVDTSSETNWLLNNRSNALFGLGHTDESIGYMSEAARQPESGAMQNVSQAINLADLYNELGRPKDALVAVSGLNLETPAASPYGRMALMEARGCAYAQLQDKENLDLSLTYLRAHVLDGKTPYLNTLICASDLNAAASELIDLVADPATRTEALAMVQPRVIHGEGTAIDRQIAERWTNLRNRADVRAAVEKVGHILGKPLPFMPR